jgi:L-amino acid N-acyltransferase YncA
MSITVRDAADDDVPAIVAIVNQLVAETTVLWTDDDDTTRARRALIEARRARGFPTLVAVDDATGEVVGHATYADFRDSIAKPGYRWTVEHTIHVRQDRTGAGIGPVLLAALIERAGAAGIHVMVAGIDGENEGSVRFHERHGFVVTARMPQVGRKFGRWLDLVLMQRYLDGADARRV